MVKTIVWQQTFGESHEVTRPILDALARAGIGALPLPPGEVDGAGVVFFDEMRTRLCDFVRDASRGGARRVLAIATGSGLTPDVSAIHYSTTSARGYCSNAPDCSPPTSG